MVEPVWQGVQALFDESVNVHPLAAMEDSVDFAENGWVKATL